MSADPAADDTPASCRVLVVGDDAGKADAVRGLLEGDFGAVQATASAKLRVADVERIRPDVLVLAFASLAAADAFCRSLPAAATEGSVLRHRTVVLTSPEELAVAFDRCKAGGFDDYALHGAQVQDPHRLAMAVWNASRRAPSARRLDAPAAPRPLVLAVEDDPLAAQALCDTLANEGIEVQVTGNATAAIAFLRQRRPALILMDVNLPGTDGLTLTSALKANPALSRIPVVILTGDATREVIGRSAAIGAAGFLVKPFAHQALMDKVSPLLRGAGSRPAPG